MTIEVYWQLYVHVGFVAAVNAFIDLLMAVYQLVFQRSCLEM